MGMATTGRRCVVNALGTAGGRALAGCARGGPAWPASSASGAPGVAKRGGTLSYADWGDATTIDPAYMDSQIGRRPGKAIFDSLVDVDPQGNIIPVLAERWEVPDPRTY